MLQATSPSCRGTWNKAWPSPRQSRTPKKSSFSTFPRSHPLGQKHLLLQQACQEGEVWGSHLHHLATWKKHFSTAGSLHRVQKLPYSHYSRAAQQQCPQWHQEWLVGIGVGSAAKVSVSSMALEQARPLPHTHINGQVVWSTNQLIK